MDELFVHLKLHLMILYIMPSQYREWTCVRIGIGWDVPK